MKFTLAAMTILTMTLTADAGEFYFTSDTYVRGYYRSTGTYIRPHYRSRRDGNFYNNWSTYPNINPYTSRRGMRITPPRPYNSNSYGGYYRNFYYSNPSGYSFGSSYGRYYGQ